MKMVEMVKKCMAGVVWVNVVEKCLTTRFLGRKEIRMFVSCRNCTEKNVITVPTLIM